MKVKSRVWLPWPCNFKAKNNAKDLQKRESLEKIEIVIKRKFLLYPLTFKLAPFCRTLCSILLVACIFIINDQSLVLNESVCRQKPLGYSRSYRPEFRSVCSPGYA